MENKSSLGVTLFGILIISHELISELLHLIIFTIARGGVPIKSFFNCLMLSIREPLYPGGFLARLIILVISFVIGCGIIMYKEWSRRILFFFICILGIYQILLMIAGFLGSTKSALFLIPILVMYILYGSIIYFFTRPKVKEQFSAKKIGGSALGGKKE